MHDFNRRQFLSLSLAGMGTLLLPRWAFAAASSLVSAEADPHFFLHIQLMGGADHSYLFDARPLEMTATQKIQNYIGEEPRIYTGVNGESCRSFSYTKILEPHLSRFSILNGVMMTPTFEGHDQNLNYLLSGNPFGGESFLPHLNLYSNDYPVLPLDGLQSGFSFQASSNLGGTVNLDPTSVDGLKKALAGSQDLGQGELSSYLASRFNSGGSGRFTEGAKKMLHGFRLAPDLKEKLLKLDVPDPAESAERQFVSLLGGAFRHGITRSGTLVINEQFDTHSFETAKEQPKLFASLCEKLAGIFAAMGATPFDKNRSLLDVTTVMVNSEFGRTMRIEGSSFATTGTNHNPLSNSFLLGGKGIRGGLVVGASDFQSGGEILSKAHSQLDPFSEKVMARPFDFENMAPRADLPEKFDARHYLTSQSIVNTIYSLFGVPPARFRTVVDRDPATAPLLQGLLSR